LLMKLPHLSRISRFAAVDRGMGDKTDRKAC
jgi:hypothetical protein